jgi:peptide/nickel transport system permease protein
MPDITTDDATKTPAAGGSMAVASTPTGDKQPGADREFTIKARTQRELIFRRFMQHRGAVVSLVIFTLLVVSAFVLGHFWHYRYDQFTNELSSPPSGKHPFGTDSDGKDLLAQVLRGTQRSMEIAMFVAIVATAVGTAYGAVSGYYGGRVDNIMMRIVDLFLTLPAIAVAAVLGHRAGESKLVTGWLLIAMILAFLGWAGVARVVRGVMLSLREKEFVEAAQALGATDRRIIFRHLLPNALGPIIVNVTIAVAVAILAETALSFVGFGVRAPDTSLGLLISQNQTAASTRPWLFYFPGLFIIVIALTVNFIGDGLRDAFDPTQTRVRA